MKKDPQTPEAKKGRPDVILSVLCLVFGAFTFLCFGVYFVKIMIFPEGALPVVACLLVFIWLFVPLVLRRFFRRVLGKAYIPVKAAYALILAAFTATFIAFLAFVFSAVDETPYEELPEGTVVVTFGAKVKENGEPGTPLARRLDKTIEILKARSDAVCVVSGGQGADEPISEAEAMKRRLVSAGIDESRIYVEDQSHNTLQNIAYSREVIEKNGLGGRAVACVSSDFHVARIRFISERTDGFGDHFYRAGGLRKWDWEYFGLTREYLSFARLLLLGTES
jgi:uncharacterized SAM-binding protein YcdF (DUF218 family)